MEVFTIVGVVAVSRITSHEFHIPVLPLACVVTVLLAGCAAKQKDNGVVDRSADSTLRLSTQLSVEFLPSVNLSLNEHLSAPLYLGSTKVWPKGDFPLHLSLRTFIIRAERFRKR